MKTTTTIKRESTNEANVSERTVLYCVYSNDKLIESFEDVCEAMDFAETI